LISDISVESGDRPDKHVGSGGLALTAAIVDSPNENGLELDAPRAETQMVRILLSSLAPVSAQPPTGWRTPMDLPVLIERVRGEFLEMPGLRLTPAQAARLWNVDSATCHRIISALVGAAFLRWTPRGTVARVES
jgi:hypothetical protein